MWCYELENLYQLWAKYQNRSTLLCKSNSSLTNLYIIEVFPGLLRYLPTPISPKNTILYFVSHKLVLYSPCIFFLYIINDFIKKFKNYKSQMYNWRILINNSQYPEKSLSVKRFALQLILISSQVLCSNFNNFTLSKK